MVRAGRVESGLRKSCVYWVGLFWWSIAHEGFRWGAASRERLTAINKLLFLTFYFCLFTLE
jgi:hypothetical protein